MARYEITVSGEFCAAHQLRLYDGTMERLHGHNWRVEVCLSGPRLDGMGVVVDFTVVRARLDAVLATLHDRFLNELPAFATVNPSAENVAKHIFDALRPDVPAGARLRHVRVTEAVGCAAAYVADDAGEG